MKLRAAALMAWVAVATAACSADTTGEAPDDQAGDVQGLAAGATKIVGLGGKCLDADAGGGFTDGDKVQIWDCYAGAEAQAWVLQGGALVGPGGKCLDARWGQTADGTPLQLYECNGTAAQQFRFEGGLLRGPGGKCVDVPASNRDNGTPLQLWGCHGGDNQRWSPGPGGGGGGGGTSADLAAAQAFVAPLTLGLNVERSYAWERTNPAYWSYLRNDLRATHVRLFYPWRPSVEMGGGSANNAPPDEGRFGRILDAAQQAMDAGLKVFLDCADVIGTEDLAFGTVEGHVDNCGRWAAARHFDPAMFALGPINEWAGADNATYNGTRRRYNDILRSHLPGYVLTTGGANWKARDAIYDDSQGFEVFADERVVYEWHHYDSWDAAGWRWSAEQLANWRARNGGRPTVCGEAGPGYWDENINGTRLANAPWAWPEHFDRQLEALAADRPMLWAVTYGGDFRMNKSIDDPHLQDGSNGSTDLRSNFRFNEGRVRAALGL